MHERSASFLAMIAVSSLACNTGKPASAVCTSSGECESGTQCLALQVTGPSGACTPATSMTCTKSCATKADCGGLVDPATGGNNPANDFSCVMCGDAGSCAIVQGSTLLPAAGVCEQSSQCIQGLSCLPLELNLPDGGCGTSSSMTCTLSCTADSDCASLVDPTNQKNDLTCSPACGSAQRTCAILN